MNKVGKIGTADSNVNDLWQGYWNGKAQGDGQIYRNLLLEHYYPLVKIIARRLKKGLSSVVDTEDLIQSGIFGLMDAIRDYDPNKSKFKTYCNSRVRGAMLDELRALDWVPRLTRNRAHQVDEVKSQFKLEKGYEPNQNEIIHKLKKYVNGTDSLEEKRISAEFILKDSQILKMTPVQNFSQGDGGYDGDASEESFAMQDKHAQTPLEELQKKELTNPIMNGLTRTEKIIIILYYYEKMSMKEIGATIGISESRVSQTHNIIMNQLKYKLTEPPKIPPGNLELMLAAS